MDAKTFDKSKLPSRHVTEGPSRAPHRSYYYAMGLTEEEIHRPFVGVVSCWNEAAPCNIALMRQAQSAKKGVASGKAVMRLVADGLRPRDICTRKAFENAATIVAATGGSTNAGLHLPAMAHECGIEFDLLEVAGIFKRTPYIADLKPGGKYVAKDVFDIGGVPQIMRALLDGGYLHEDCLTVTGKTIKQNLENVKFNTDQKVVYPVSKPISADGRRRWPARARWRPRAPS